MSLPLLPIELLTRIARETLPEGFESFALTCRATYHVSESLIQFHNGLKRQYRNLTLAENYTTNHGKPTCTLQLLARIAEEPLIAKYIISASLVNEPSTEYASEVEEPEDFPDVQLQEMKKSSFPLLQLLKSVPYFEDASIDANDMLNFLFSDFSNSSGGGMSVAILLSLLSNATEIALPARWKFYDENGILERPGEEPIGFETGHMINDIIQRANDPSQPHAGLSKLTTILPSIGWGYDAHWDLDTFNAFLSIKSVKKFIMGGSKALDDSYTGPPFIEPEQGSSFGSGLEEVQLAGACANGIELRKFLKWMPKLKTFKFSFETKWHGCGHDWNKTAAMSAIEDTTCDTLEDLSFSIVNCYGGTGPSITSMKKFKKLKRLELQLGCLKGLPYEMDDEAEGATDYDNVKFHKLSDILPSSIEELVLWDWHMFDENGILGDDLFPELLEDLSEERVQKLPQLRKIVILGAWTHPNRESGSPDITDVLLSGDSAEFRKSDKLVELAALRKDIIVQLRIVDSSRVGPLFMAGFCEKYGVEHL